MIGAAQNPLLRRFLLAVSLLLMVALSGCALLPPVQEMSNARQSLQAAKIAGAEVHDSKRFSQATMLLEVASQKIDAGEYIQAKNLAIKVHAMAIKARLIAISKN